MNLANLNPDELKQLQELLNKMNPNSTEKVYFDPFNKMVDDIMDEFNFAKVQSAMRHLEWKWAGVQAKEGKADMTTVKYFEEKDCMEALDYIGIFENQ